MSGMKVLLIFFGVVGAIILMFVGFAVLVALSINGNDNMEEGDFIFWLVVPEYMQSFPAQGDCLEARYAYEGRDGERAGFGSIIFGTYSEEKRMSEIKTWFEKKSCVVKEAEFSMTAERCQNELFYSSEVKLFKERTAQACYLINVEFID